MAKTKVCVKNAIGRVFVRLIIQTIIQIIMANQYLLAGIAQSNYFSDKRYN